MKGRAQAILVWVVAPVVVGLLGWIGYCNFKLLQVQPPSQTVVYIQDGQGSQGVPFYDAPVPRQPAVGLLRNFTRVDMVCWVDDGTERWFYVRVGPNESMVREGRVVAVRAAHTWNQTQTDRC